MDTKVTNHVSYGLTNPFHNSIGLCVSNGHEMLVMPQSFHTISENSSRISLPLPSMICVGHGYLFKHICSITLDMTSDCLVFILTISNHPVAGSIMVTHHSVRLCFLFPFLSTPFQGIL